MRYFSEFRNRHEMAGGLGELAVTTICALPTNGRVWTEEDERKSGENCADERARAVRQQERLNLPD
jgi:hypothetical protein